MNGPAELNGRVSRSSPLVKAAITGVAVSLIGAIGGYIWNLQSELQDLQVELGRDYVLMAVHRADLSRLEDWMSEGERFTLERGEGVEEDLNTLTKQHEALRLEVAENKLVLARMPLNLRYPFTTAMQQRLVDAEKAIAIQNQRLNELERRSTNRE